MPKHKKGGYSFKNKSVHDFDSIQGILFTCNSSRQREAVQEAIGLLEQFGEKIVENDTLLSDIIEVLEKEKTKQQNATKKRQNKINQKSKKENPEKKVNALTNQIASSEPVVQSNQQPAEDAIIETVPSLSASNSVISNESLSFTANTSTELPSEQGAPSMPSSTTEQTTTATSASEQTQHITQTTLTTWQVKERQTPSEDIDSKLLPCDFLEGEVKIVKDGKKDFESLETGVTGQIFIRIKNRKISPLVLCKKMAKNFEKAHSRMEDISSRFLFKMYPIFDLFPANEKNLTNRFQKLLEDHKDDLDKQLKYMVHFKAHHSNTLQKKLALDIIEEKVKHFSVAEIYHPNEEFYVFLIKGRCLLGYANECQSYNFNINAMRLITTQEQELKENQRMASKRKQNETTEEASLEIADMIEDTTTPAEPSTITEDEMAVIEQTTTEDDKMTSSSSTSLPENSIVMIDMDEGNDTTTETLQDETPITYSTVTKHIYSKRRKIQNHPSIELEDIKVI
ncbi:hypothetical protein C9374_005981 [Naegleria lovaniensis]|uniref:THUMP domain-containing protein n=1 Tax=Naegleria lovaniensis TaxID=51637 RepID=A0AA88KB47_NAELO|nr:uncharacterized protein C9374_014731 [Naegleria lovaniensis]XP_044547277.1 uncharacterized protein C9374_005981 [Naegleria lovaniensis]KAG2370629.1 hypothetical protein C9374_014731 [Naegleria lovaniensis]KAG2381597.1 hypothetical protein C9374_005981 [Naegleria lovaniensis]